MVTISIFGKEGCAKCSTTKNKIRHFMTQWEMDHKVEIVFHDMDTLDGRAEGAFYDVQDVPLTIIAQNGRQLARWDGEVPNSRSVKAALGF